MISLAPTGGWLRLHGATLVASSRLTHIDECNKKVQNRHQVAGSFVDLNSCLVMTNRVERVIILRAVGLDRTTAFKYSVHLDELHG